MSDRIVAHRRHWTLRNATVRLLYLATRDVQLRVSALEGREIGLPLYGQSVATSRRNNQAAMPHFSELRQVARFG